MYEVKRFFGCICFLSVFVALFFCLLDALGFYSLVSLFDKFLI